MQYECVIRRRHRMGMEIVAVGPMLWSDEHKAFCFTWRVPEDFTPNPAVIVQVDVYDGDERCGCLELLKFMYRWDACVWRYPGRPRDDDADEGKADDPTPPALALTFDPDTLLQPLVAVTRQ